MDKTKVIHTVFGTKKKYEVVEKESDHSFRIYKGGEYHRGPFKNLRDAVKACEEDAEKGR